MLCDWVRDERSWLDLAGEVVGLLALWAEGQQPERDASTTTTSIETIMRLEVRTSASGGSGRGRRGGGGRRTRVGRGRRCDGPGIRGGDRGGVEGGDDLELGDEFAGLAGGAGRARSESVEALEPLAELPELVANWEDCTPTRVTPSMSLSVETKPATASCPVAQPTISSAGPGTESRSADAGASVDLDVGADGAGQVGQPDVIGQDQRQFPHHPFPVEAAVGEAGHRGDPLVADARGTACRRPAAWPSGLAPRRSAAPSWVTSALRSEIWLSVMTSSVTPSEQRRPARRRRRRRAGRLAAGALVAALLGGDQVDGAHRQPSRARP